MTYSIIYYSNKKTLLVDTQIASNEAEAMLESFLRNKNFITSNLITEVETIQTEETRFLVSFVYQFEVLKSVEVVATSKERAIARATVREQNYIASVALTNISAEPIVHSSPAN